MGRGGAGVGSKDELTGQSRRVQDRMQVRIERAERTEPDVTQFLDTTQYRIG